MSRDPEARLVGRSPVQSRDCSRVIMTLDVSQSTNCCAARSKGRQLINSLVMSLNAPTHAGRAQTIFIIRLFMHETV